MIAAGTRLGPYEVLGPLGAGGMGEVYRARDTRLSREVAIKVLPAAVASDPSRLKRFEKEARSASALNHPNIVTIYDVGSSDSLSWIAMERVEGKTLRELLIGGAPPIKKLLPIAAQIADGLAKAHEAGILHRDLKPENVMVTKDGLVKILDFGLAKLTRADSDSGEDSHLPTETGTSPGVVLGTVGYMSPEQAAGQPLDFRSDQFSLGSILYEMATGKRAFQKSTAVDTLSAILHDEPKPVAEINPQAPVPLRWIVERCLAKEPRLRYASTEDLARELATIRDHLSEAVSGARLAVGVGPRRRTALGLILGAIALIAASVFAGRALWKTSPTPPPKFHRLTFRRGAVVRARFAPDGQTVIYSANWGTDPSQVFMTRIGNPESLKLPVPDSTGLFAVSSKSDLALRLGDPAIAPGLGAVGTLATMPLAGGAPREVADDVQSADWTPDGKDMLVLRNGRLEFPIGKVLYEAPSISSPRFSPTGVRIAFRESQADLSGLGDAGEWWISIIDLAGKRTELRQAAKRSIVWNSTGDEIWFSSGAPGEVDTIRAVTLKGRSRVVTRLPANFALQDVSRDGRVLLAMGNTRNEAWCLPAGETKERDLGWFALTDAADISADGKAVLLREYGEAGGSGGASYLRRIDGSPAVKVTEGTAEALSPNARWAACVREKPPRILLVPTGAGEAKTIVNEGFEEYLQSVNQMRFSPDGRSLFFVGRERGQQERLYEQNLEGGKPRAISTEGIVGSFAVSPDGKLVIADQPDGFWIYPVAGGERRPLRGVLQTEYVASWSTDGRAVYAVGGPRPPFQISRVELATGRREPWKTIAPADLTGVFSSDLLLLPNGTYVLNVKRWLSDLYLVEGLK